MLMNIDLPALPPILATGALIVFILYRRIRRSIGRQKLAPRRMGLRIGLFAHTQFEATGEGKFYTPHPYISLGVIALFIGRIAYRLLLPGGFTPGAASPAGMFAGIAANPITLGLNFVMSIYYNCFYAGVLRKAESLAAPS